MRTVITWASSGINGGAVLPATRLLLISIRSQSYPATFVIPLMVVERMHSPRPVDVEGPVGDDAGSERRKLTLEVDNGNVGTGPLCR